MSFDCSAAAGDRNASIGPLDIDYLYIHYCVFAGAPIVSYAFLLLWLCALFFFLGSTADGYFSPTLASISEKLHVPYDVAGVTFLAFGNGAPDVFSAIAAYSSGVGETGTNELLGGSMFVSNVVVGCVAIASSVNVQRWAFTRDMFGLIIALLLLLLLASTSGSSESATGGLTSVAGVLFILTYAVYVSSVVLPTCIQKFRHRHGTSLRPGEVDTATKGGVLSAFWLALSPRGKGRQADSAYTFVTKAPQAPLSPSGHPSVELGSPRKKAATFGGDVVEDHFQDVLDDDASLTSPLISDDERTWISSSDGIELSGNRAVDPAFLAQFSNGAKILESAYWRHLRWRWRLTRRIVEVYGGTESRLVKALSLPHILLVLMRDMTVPLLDQGTWSRTLASISWITVPQLALWATGNASASIGTSQTPLWMVLLAAGSLCGVVVSYTTHRSRAPESLVYCALFLLVAFVACVSWIYTVANELVALLVAVGTITHASNSLLGLTVLSWGNSVGDLITNVSVARAGFPEMAIAGCYGGPVFNILLGLGIPMVLAFLRGESQHVSFDDHAWVSIGFLFFTLLSSYHVFRTHDYKCPAWYGKLLLAYYAVYTIVNVAIAWKIHNEDIDS